MLNIVLFGPPGSGKGTQAGELQQKYGLIHVSTGEMIREEVRRGTEIGKLAEKQMAGGNLASDEIVCQIVCNFMENNADAEGIIYDGFPRTLTQAVEFDKILSQHGESVTLMIALSVPDEVVMSRIKARAKVSGRNDDNNEDITRRRIDVYNAQTTVVSEYYKGQGKLRVVDGTGSIESTFLEISRHIDEVRR